MGAWEDLLTTAVVGTERRPLAVTPPAGTLGQVAAGLADRASEATLLGLAVATELHRRAGRLPALDRRPLPAPAPADDLPRCSARAGARLLRILDGERGVLPEWLAAVATVGRRVPETALPALLDAGRHSRDLQPAILAVLGGRGRWLAAQNPDWEWAVGAGDDETDWQTGGRAARLAVLVKERQAAPDQARDRLAAGWGQETAEDRAAFIQTFEVGLSMADEPFLEAALDDRRKEVRTAAAGLLARLPESRLVARMIERLTPLLHFIAEEPARLLPPSSGRKAQLVVTLPEAHETAMLRDGIQTRSTGSGQHGEKSWWLYQMIGAVPPAHWSRGWASEPETLIDAAARNDWQTQLIDGWWQATERHQDSQWAKALIDYNPARCASLLKILLIEQRETVVLNMIRRLGTTASDQDCALGLAMACRHRWSPEFTEAMLQAICDWLSQGKLTNDSKWGWVTALSELAHFMPLSSVRTLADRWPPEIQERDSWRDSIARAVSLLQFRHDMLKEIEE